MGFRAPIAVFDLDGTLADTAADLVSTLNLVLGGEGVPPLPIEQARELIGNGGRVLISKGFAAAGRELTPERLDRLYLAFLKAYGQDICRETALFPGAREALDRLEAAGFALAICTNKIEAHSVRLAQALGIADRFAANCGRDTFAWFKPDPRHLLMTIERAGGDPARAIMVGDSTSDVGAAKAAGVPAIAVSFGYSETPARALGADLVIDRFDELFGGIERLVPAMAA
jgi:phosphoglycolate phosphatase